MKGRIIPGRRRGAYLTEKLVGFRIPPDDYEKLKAEASKRRLTVAQLINQVLNERFGWSPKLDFGK